MNEGMSSTSQNEGGSEGDVMDPFTGNLQLFSDALEPSICPSELICRPTKRLVEDSLFGCPVLHQSRFQHLNLCTKVLHTKSFIAVQLGHNECMHRLDDGTVSQMDSCAFQQPYQTMTHTFTVR
jgi:hypothetical protein